jgi:hypothetical protein
MEAERMANHTRKEENDEKALAADLDSIMMEANTDVQELAEANGMSDAMLMVVKMEADKGAHHTREEEEEEKKVDQALDSIMKEADLAEAATKEELAEENHYIVEDALTMEAEREANHTREVEDEEKDVEQALDSIMKEADLVEVELDKELLGDAPTEAQRMTNHTQKEEKEEKNIDQALDSIMEEAAIAETTVDLEQMGDAPTEAHLAANHTREEEKEEKAVNQALDSVMKEAELAMTTVDIMAPLNQTKGEFEEENQVERAANHAQEEKDEEEAVDQALDSIMKEAELAEMTVDIMEPLNQTKGEFKEENHAEQVTSHAREEKDEEEAIAAALDSVVNEAEGAELAVDTEVVNHP